AATTCMPAKPKQSILFMCPHGGAKSLIAASYFNRSAAADHLPYVASAAAAENPYNAVPPRIADLLEREGFAVRSFKPRHVDASDLSAAAKVVTIGCDMTKLDARGVTIEHWDDVPMVDDDLPGSAATIRAHVATLVKQLETGR